MSKYVHNTSLWATGHSLNDDDVAPRANGGDNLLYLEHVQRMVALV